MNKPTLKSMELLSVPNHSMKVPSKSVTVINRDWWISLASLFLPTQGAEVSLWVEVLLFGNDTLQSIIGRAWAVDKHMPLGRIRTHIPRLPLLPPPLGHCVQGSCMQNLVAWALIYLKQFLSGTHIYWDQAKTKPFLTFSFPTEVQYILLASVSWRSVLFVLLLFWFVKTWYRGAKQMSTST